MTRFIKYLISRVMIVVFRVEMKEKTLCGQQQPLPHLPFHSTFFTHSFTCTHIHKRIERKNDVVLVADW